MQNVLAREKQFLHAYAHQLKRVKIFLSQTAKDQCLVSEIKKVGSLETFSRLDWYNSDGICVLFYLKAISDCEATHNKQ